MRVGGEEWGRGDGEGGEDGRGVGVGGIGMGGRLLGA